MLACLLVWVLLAAVAVGCPDKCQCSKDNHRVVCEHARLQEVPKDIPLSCEELYLGNNILTKITKDDFSKIKNMTYLALNENNIADLDVGAFRGLAKLTSLTLRGNKMGHIDGEVFVGLNKLEYLYLSQNNLEAIPDLGHLVALKHVTLDNNQITNATFPESFSALTNLSQIIMANNYQLSSIGANAFNALANSRLSKLNLPRCGLTMVDAAALKPLKNLISLSLSYNPGLSPASLKTLLDGLSGSRLNSLDLSGVLGSGNLPPTTFEALAKVPLLQLSLSNSKIDVLVDNTFTSFPKLTRLDLSHSSIENAQTHAFVGLDSLQTLKLYLNDLSIVPSNLPENVVALDLSFNPHLSQVPADVFISIRHMKELRLHHCALLTLPSDALRGVELLEVLDLSHNQISGNGIGIQVMRDLNQLKYLFLNNNNMARIENEYSLFSGLHSLYYLDFRENGLSTIPDTLFDPLVQLELLHLQQNNMGGYLKNDVSGKTFAKLRSLRELHLEDNNINSLPRHLFVGLTSLGTLGLRHNKLNVLDAALLEPLPSLKRVDISSNLLTVVQPKALPERPMALNLSQNPWDCWCGLIAFRNWMDESHNITLVNSSTYTCHSPQSMLGKPLKSFQPASISSNCHWTYVLYGTLGAFAVVVFVVSGVMYSNRWRLRLSWYKCKRRMRRRPPHGQAGYEPIAGQDFQHDAFVMVAEDADDDIRWVENELLPAVHNGDGCGGEDQDFRGRHRLFYPAVHYGKGLRYMEMLETIESCRCLVVVLSQTALQSRDRKFRDFELGLALEIVTQRGWSSVILVLQEPQAAGELQAAASKPFRDRIANNGALQWTEDPNGQELFWGRLQELLDGENEDEVRPINV